MEGRFAILLVCLLFAASSRASGHGSAPQPPAGDGEVYVYLQPLPSDAERIGFSIETAVSAQRSGRRTFPSSCRSGPSRGPRSGDSGCSPSGVSLLEGMPRCRSRCARRSSASSSGEAALLVPDTAVRADVAFVVPRGRALVLWLDFRPEASLAGASVFSPVFSAIVAPRPMLSLAGFVSNSQSNSITVFDKRLRQASAVIPTGDGPAGHGPRSTGGQAVRGL